VTTCTSQKKIADLLKYQSFDIILAEVSAEARVSLVSPHDDPFVACIFT
jgi:hypothetical protein